MGVHDYRCSACGTPSSYECGEKHGKACGVKGLGEDQAVLDLFYFDAEDAPETPEDFEDARARARRVETRPFGYDWGEWEFVPSLNYRQLLMDDEDPLGIWAIQPFDDDLDDGNPVSLSIPEGEQVWVVNYCPPCHTLFVKRQTPEEEPCREYLSAVAEQLGLEFDADGGSVVKAPFIEQVRERIARRQRVAK